MAIRSKKRVKRQHGVASDNLPSQHHVYEEEQPEEEPLAERKRSHKVAKMASIFCGYSYYSSSIFASIQKQYKDINIPDVLLNTRPYATALQPAVGTAASQDSYFLKSCLDEYGGKYSSGEFVSLFNQIDPLCRTLPLVIHNEKRILSTLKDSIIPSAGEESLLLSISCISCLCHLEVSSRHIQKYVIPAVKNVHSFLFDQRPQSSPPSVLLLESFLRMLVSVIALSSDSTDGDFVSVLSSSPSFQVRLTGALSLVHKLSFELIYSLVSSVITPTPQSVEWAAFTLGTSLRTATSLPPSIFKVPSLEKPEMQQATCYAFVACSLPSSAKSTTFARKGHSLYEELVLPLLKVESMPASLVTATISKIASIAGASSMDLSPMISVLKSLIRGSNGENAGGAVDALAIVLCAMTRCPLSSSHTPILLDDLQNISNMKRLLSMLSTVLHIDADNIDINNCLGDFFSSLLCCIMHIETQKINEERVLVDTEHLFLSSWISSIIERLSRTAAGALIVKMSLERMKGDILKSFSSLSLEYSNNPHDPAVVGGFSFIGELVARMAHHLDRSDFQYLSESLQWYINSPAIKGGHPSLSISLIQIVSCAESHHNSISQHFYTSVIESCRFLLRLCSRKPEHISELCIMAPSSLVALLKALTKLSQVVNIEYPPLKVVSTLQDSLLSRWEDVRRASLALAGAMAPSTLGPLSSSLLELMDGVSLNTVRQKIFILLHPIIEKLNEKDGPLQHGGPEDREKARDRSVDNRHGDTSVGCRLFLVNSLMGMLAIPFRPFQQALGPALVKASRGPAGKQALWDAWSRSWTLIHNSHEQSTDSILASLLSSSTSIARSASRDTPLLCMLSSFVQMPSYHAHHQAIKYCQNIRRQEKTLNYHHPSALQNVLSETLASMISEDALSAFPEAYTSVGHLFLSASDKMSTTVDAGNSHRQISLLEDCASVDGRLHNHTCCLAIPHNKKQIVFPLLQVFQKWSPPGGVSHCLAGHLACAFIDCLANGDRALQNAALDALFLLPMVRTVAGGSSGWSACKLRLVELLDERRWKDALKDLRLFVEATHFSFDDVANETMTKASSSLPSLFSKKPAVDLPAIVMALLHGKMVDVRRMHTGAQSSSCKIIISAVVSLLPTAWWGHLLVRIMSPFVHLREAPGSDTGTHRCHDKEEDGYDGNTGDSRNCAANGLYGGPLKIKQHDLQTSTLLHVPEMPAIGGLVSFLDQFARTAGHSLPIQYRTEIIHMLCILLSLIQENDNDDGKHPEDGQEMDLANVPDDGGLDIQGRKGFRSRPHESKVRGQSPSAETASFSFSTSRNKSLLQKILLLMSTAMMKCPSGDQPEISLLLKKSSSSSIFRLKIWFPLMASIAKNVPSEGMVSLVEALVHIGDSFIIFDLMTSRDGPYCMSGLECLFSSLRTHMAVLSGRIIQRLVSCSSLIIQKVIELSSRYYHENGQPQQPSRRNPEQTHSSSTGDGGMSPRCRTTFVGDDHPSVGCLSDGEISSLMDSFFGILVMLMKTVPLDKTKTAARKWNPIEMTVGIFSSFRNELRLWKGLPTLTPALLFSIQEGVGILTASTISSAMDILSLCIQGASIYKHENGENNTSGDAFLPGHCQGSSSEHFGTIHPDSASSSPKCPLDTPTFSLLASLWQVAPSAVQTSLSMMWRRLAADPFLGLQHTVPLLCNLSDAHHDGGGEGHVSAHAAFVQLVSFLKSNSAADDVRCFVSPHSRIYFWKMVSHYAMYAAVTFSGDLAKRHHAFTLLDVLIDRGNENENADANIDGCNSGHVDGDRLFLPFFSETVVNKWIRSCLTGGKLSMHIEDDSLLMEMSILLSKIIHVQKTKAPKPSETAKKSSVEPCSSSPAGDGACASLLSSCLSPFSWHCVVHPMLAEIFVPSDMENEEPGNDADLLTSLYHHQLQRRRRALARIHDKILKMAAESKQMQKEDFAAQIAFCEPPSSLCGHPDATCSIPSGRADNIDDTVCGHAVHVRGGDRARPSLFTVHFFREIVCKWILPLAVNFLKLGSSEEVPQSHVPIQDAAIKLIALLLHKDICPLPSYYIYFVKKVVHLVVHAAAPDGKKSSLYLCHQRVQNPQCHVNVLIRLLVDVLSVDPPKARSSKEMYTPETTTNENSISMDAPSSPFDVFVESFLVGKMLPLVTKMSTSTATSSSGMAVCKSIRTPIASVLFKLASGVKSKERKERIVKILLPPILDSLKSRTDKVRAQARAVLQQSLRALGPDYLSIFVNHIHSALAPASAAFFLRTVKDNPACDKSMSFKERGRLYHGGYLRHVVGYTLYALLSALASRHEKKRASKPGKSDQRNEDCGPCDQRADLGHFWPQSKLERAFLEHPEVVQRLAYVFFDMALGSLAAEKASDAWVNSMAEVKEQKGPEAFYLLVKAVPASLLVNVLEPILESSFNRAIEASQGLSEESRRARDSARGPALPRHALIDKMRALHARIAAAYRDNPSVCQEDNLPGILTLLYRHITRTRLRRGLEQKDGHSETDNAGGHHDLQNVRFSSPLDGLKVAFSLSVLNHLLSERVFSAANKRHLELLHPFCQTILTSILLPDKKRKNALIFEDTYDENVMAAALKAVSLLAKYPFACMTSSLIDSLNSKIVHVLTRERIHDFSSPFVLRCFSWVAMVLRGELYVARGGKNEKEAREDGKDAIGSGAHVGATGDSSMPGRERSIRQRATLSARAVATLVKARLGEDALASFDVQSTEVAPVFAVVKAIFSANPPYGLAEVYGLGESLLVRMLNAQTSSVRALCGQSLFAFLTTYPMTDKKMASLVSRIISQIAHPWEEARLSVILLVRDTLVTLCNAGRGGWIVQIKEPLVLQMLLAISQEHVKALQEELKKTILSVHGLLGELSVDVSFVGRLLESWILDIKRKEEQNVVDSKRRQLLILCLWTINLMPSQRRASQLKSLSQECDRHGDDQVIVSLIKEAAKE